MNPMMYTLPAIAALIGWITNYLAIKMLFHPRKPVKLLFITIQGIFPKRQKAIAEKLGSIVANELISLDDLKDKINSEESRAEVARVLDEKIEVFLRDKLKEKMPMLGMFINDNTVGTIKGAMMAEIEGFLPEVLHRFSTQLDQHVDVEKIVYDKVVAFSTDKLEEILFAIMKKEFRFIEIVGAVLGFVIGWAQILLMYLT